MKKRFKEGQHIVKQKEYFNKEFSGLTGYKLEPWQKSYIKKIKNELIDKDNVKNSKLLDIGAGSGYVSIEMAKLGLRVIACDVSKKSLFYINKIKNTLLIDNLKTIESKADSIPIRSRSVNYIVANAILEHIPNEKKAIEEWKRVLKKKGKIFIVTPLKYRYLNPLFWIVNYIHDKNIGHLRRYDAADFAEKFQMNIVKRYYTGHFLKTIWTIVSIIYKNEFIDKKIEKIDDILSNKRWGASNVIAILQS